MTGAEKIKAKILEDAQAKARKIEQQARDEARGILDSASQEAALKKAEALKSADADGQELYRRLLSVAGLEGRKEILRAKQDMVEAAFHNAMQKIIQLPDSQYQKLLEDMVVQAATKGGGEILMSEKDKNRLDKLFLQNINQRLAAKGITTGLSLSNESIRSAGGFILRFGDMEINSTLEILFDMIRPELESEVVKILF